jgi:hypothetical protein
MVKEANASYYYDGPLNLTITQSSRSEFQTDLNALYWDLRVGAIFYFNDYFALSIALDFSSGLITIPTTSNMVETFLEDVKYELGCPITLHYQF